MGKFTAEEKISAVLRYLSSADSSRGIAKSIGVSHSILMNWVHRYQRYGTRAFEKSYTSYTGAFKLDVLNYMKVHGMSSYEVAVHFGIPSPGLVRTWMSLAEKFGMDAFEPKKKGRLSMTKKNQKSTRQQELVEGSVEALQAELEHLRMENAYLKKLNALIQNKKQSPNKTKRK